MLVRPAQCRALLRMLVPRPLIELWFQRGEVVIR